jgi:hypothetical protein
LPVFGAEVTDMITVCLWMASLYLAWNCSIKYKKTAVLSFLAISSTTPTFFRLEEAFGIRPALCDDPPFSLHENREAFYALAEE